MSGFFGLKKEFIIDVRSVRNCTYVEFFNRPVIFC